MASLFNLAAVVLLITVPSACLAARDLQQKMTGNGDVYNGAQVITPAQAKNPAARTGVTGMTAESSANAAFNGVHRLINPRDKRIYAVVESDGNASPTSAGSQSRAVAARARSAQDVPSGPNRATGGNSMPALVTGQMVKAQTYQGATAVATTDSVALNRGRGSAIATDRLTTRTGTMRRAGPNGSFGVSGEPVLSKAMAGAANGKIVLARADQAVSMTQVEAP